MTFMSNKVNKQGLDSGIFSSKSPVDFPKQKPKLLNDPSTKQNMEECSLKDSLFLKMRGFLMFGRIVGILPVSGVFTSSEYLTWRFGSIATITNLVISSSVAFSVIMAILESIHHPKSNALQIATSVQGTVFRVWALFTYIYFLWRAEIFIDIFKSWRKSIVLFSAKDKTLRRDITLISIFLYISSTLEWAIIHLEYFPQFDKWNGHSHKGNITAVGTITKSTFQIYFERSHGDWHRYFDYHPVLALFAFVSHKFVVICWVYVDTAIIIFARALNGTFKRLYDVSKKKVEAFENTGQNKNDLKVDANDWIGIVKDHISLCTLLESFEMFLSPLIFGSYSINIYYICMQLIEGLSPDKTKDNLVHSVFAPLSFLNLLIRSFLVSITAASINTYAHQLGKTFKKCPIEFYNEEVARVDRHVTSGPDIGLSGLGCYTVKTSFILSVINVIFTVMIILIQSIPMPSSTCS